MKVYLKLYCPILLLVLGLTSIQAQERCLNYGLKAGATYGTPIGPAEEGATGSPGISPILGLYADYSLAPRWGLQSELYFTQKRARFSSPVYDQVYSYKYVPRTNPDTTVFIETLFNGTVKGRFNNKYLEMPVLGYFQAGNQFRVLFGPFVSYLLSAENSGTATGNVGFGNLPVEEEPFDEAENINNWDIGVAGGVRFDTKFGLNCEFRITGGLRSVYKPSYTLREEAVRNVYLQLTAGYKIHSLCMKSKSDRPILDK